MLKAIAESTHNYLVENSEGLSAEEAAVTAFLRLRVGELLEESRRQLGTPERIRRNEAQPAVTAVLA
jgi:hypothetical protein